MFGGAISTRFCTKYDDIRAMSVALLNMANAQFSHSRDCSHDNNAEISAILQRRINLKGIFYKHPITSLTSASLSPVSPLDNIFALSAEVFLSCLAIISAVMAGGVFLCPALRYGTGYQTVWEIRPSAKTPSTIHWRRFYFQLACVHSALELSGWCTLQIYLLTYLLIFQFKTDAFCCLCNTAQLLECWSSKFTITCHSTSEDTVTDQWTRGFGSAIREVRHSGGPLFRRFAIPQVRHERAQWGIGVWAC